MWVDEWETCSGTCMVAPPIPLVTRNHVLICHSDDTQTRLTQNGTAAAPMFYLACKLLSLSKSPIPSSCFPLAGKPLMQPEECFLYAPVQRLPPGRFHPC